MNISEKNSLKTEIKEIVELCEKAIPEYGEKATYFRDGASEEEIAQWEKDNMLMIPEEYKDWLRVARSIVLRQKWKRFRAFMESTAKSF